jgi:hypothetical protein
LEDTDPPDFPCRLVLRDDRRSEEADGDRDHDLGQPYEQPTREYSCPEELAV